LAVGKKNWLFIGSLRAGIRNSNLMTLVASAHRHDLDIFEYLRDAIEHLNRGTASPSELLPDVWKASHPEAVRVYREVEPRDKAELAMLLVWISAASEVFFIGLAQLVFTANVQHANL
jgi:transposase